nr:MAG TPA: U3 small nucleolar ribonucleoprotein [Caudoviricetes sp.]
MFNSLFYKLDPFTMLLAHVPPPFIFLIELKS